MPELRRCRAGEIQGVMAFIDEHWRKGHVLATSRALMDWQYRAEDGSYNFIVAMEGDKLLGVLGYIPEDHYDATLKGKGIAWLALWKLRDDVKVAGLGLSMLRHLEKLIGSAAVGVNGINATHPPMYKAMGYQTGHLHHHYVVNPDAPQTLMNSSAPQQVFPYPASGEADMHELDIAGLESMAVQWPITNHKSPASFSKRYLQHPFYRYHAYLLEHRSSRGLIVARVADHGQAAALRLVDFIGDVDVLAESGSSLHRLMQDLKVEYTDFLNAGLPPHVLEHAGFADLDFAGHVIVPNRFEPLERRNVKVLYAIKSASARDIKIFRGDGDQDRPNVLEAGYG
jgi:hypothetical protein